MTTIRNLTPHPVHVGGMEIAPDPAGPARVSTSSTVVGEVTLPNGTKVPLKREVFGEPTGLPEARPDTILIVSRIVQAAVPGRSDLVAPTDLERDERGRIIGACAFAVS